MSDNEPLVNVDVSAELATLTLNRPGKKNAMNPPLHTEMLDRLTELRNRTDLKALVVTGAGDSFCAGMDLEECFRNPFAEPERFESENQRAQAWFRVLKDFPVPTIAKVNGWCFGGGVLIVGLCDMAIAADDVTFGLSEINFGSFPGGGTTWSVAHNIGRKQALYLILTGKPFSAAEAERIGLVNASVARADLDEEVASLTRTLCGKHRSVLVAAKEVYEGTHGKTFAESIDWEMAKLYELSYLTGHEWITKALKQFADREYRPGFEPYNLGD